MRPAGPLRQAVTATATPPQAARRTHLVVRLAREGSVVVAIYHFHVQVISRSAGRSATSAAAYRSGARIEDARTGRVADYTHKGGVVASSVFLPDSAPREWTDRSALWNAVERAERRADSQLAREFDMALPTELPRDRQWRLARDFARSLAAEGMCADVAMHDKGDGNPHAHVMATMRPCDESGFLPKSRTMYLMRDGVGAERWATAREAKDLRGWAKVYQYKGKSGKLTEAEAAAMGLDPKRDRKRKQPVQRTEYATKDWSSPDKLEEWRERWQDMANAELERAGSPARIDHRSNEARGIEAAATIHEGPAVREMERRAMAEAAAAGRAYEPITERGAANAEARADSEARERRLSAPLAAAPRIDAEDARADILALSAAMPSAVDAMDASAAKASEVAAAASARPARRLAGGWVAADPAASAADAANEAMRSAWDEGARAVRDLFEAALASLRSYVARLLVLMEQRRHEGVAVTREEAARWALSREPDAPRQQGRGRARQADGGRQRELAPSPDTGRGRQRQRTPGL